MINGKKRGEPYGKYTVLLALCLLLYGICESPAEAFGGRKGLGKKKKPETVRQVKIRLPYTQDDSERMGHVNRWKYYQAFLEDTLGENAKKDKSFLLKAAQELQTLKEAYPNSPDIFDEGITIYNEASDKMAKRAISPTEALRIRDALEEYRRKLGLAIREFQSGGFFD